MIRATVVTSLVASALVIGVACPHAGTSAKAKVRMIDPAPLELRGIGFERGERVRLTVSLGTRTVERKLRANGAGVFETSYELRYGRCGPSLAVDAIGSRGSRVSWELVPLECPDRADS